MDKKIKTLVQRFDEGVASSSDLQEIESLIEKGILDLDQIPGFSRLIKLVDSSFYHDIKMPESDVIQKLVHELEQAPEKSFNRRTIKRYFFDLSWQNLARIAAVLVIGLLGGYFFHDLQDQSLELDNLSSEVSAMKYQMMLSHLQRPIAQERLNAVRLTSDLSTLDRQLAFTLIQALTSDQNVNVRLAALEVLAKYIHLPYVREGLIQSIPYQDAPLVQLKVAELMGEMHLKKALEPLQNWLADHDYQEPFQTDFLQFLEPLNFEL